MDRAFQRIRSLMLRDTFYSVPPKTYCPQLVAKQTFFSDFAIQSYSWIRMHQSAYDFFYP